MENLSVGIKGVLYVLGAIALFYGGFALFAFGIVFAPIPTMIAAIIIFVWLCGAFLRLTGRLIARGNDHLNKN